MAAWERQDDPREADRWWRSPLAWAAAAWATGLLLGRECGGVWAWVGLGSASLVTAACLVPRGWARAGGVLVAASIVAAGAAWWNARTSTGGLVAEPISRLTRVEGVVEGEVFIRTEAKGVMGRFDYRPPATLFLMNVDRAQGEKGWRAVTGRVLAESPGFDGRIRPGDRVRCTGWLSSPTAPANPGEPDRRVEMRDQGVIGHLAMRDPGNCELIEAASHGWRERLAAGAKWSLRLGLNEGQDPSRRETVELIEVLLLGDWEGDLEDVRGAFRRAGLMHVLAISGLQLAILAGGTWLVLLPLLGRPRAAAVGAIMAVGLLLLVVPPSVAVLRSGLMSAAACAALVSGRRVSAMAALCGAAIVLLAWRPWDLFSAGFQLTFLVVGALIVLAPRVSRWIVPPPLIDTGGGSWQWLGRKIGDTLAVTLVAWCVFTPLGAYHFGAIVPAGLLTAVPTLPLVWLLMWFGYTKLLLTATWPAAGVTLSAPLIALAEGLKWIAESTASWPPALFEVPRPSAAWAITALLVVLAIFHGRFAGRLRAAAACLALLALWLLLPAHAQRLRDRADPAALRVNMFAVGHGSCYLVRSGGASLIFDCGSSQYLDIATSTVAPALRVMGVRRVDTLVISHPDTDHFSGAVELVDAVGVRRVVTTLAFLEEAARDPGGAAEVFVEEMRARGVPIEEAAAGWRERLGEAELRIAWPPAGRRFENQNDGSIVLAVEARGRRVLFTGDIQREAMEQMSRESSLMESLAADVIELPHHGAMDDAAAGFVRVLRPSIVLQSCNLNRLRNDPWENALGGATRHVSARHGMVEITVRLDGRLDSRRFSENLWPGTGVETYSEPWPRLELNP